MRAVHSKLKFLLLLCMLAALLVGCSKEKPKPFDIPETETPTPEISGTPTPRFRDPQETGVYLDVESYEPLVLGRLQSVWETVPSTEVKSRVSGRGDTKGWFKFLWDEDSLYILAHVEDNTYDDSGEDVFNRDCVFLFINEDGTKHDHYGVGDAFYVIERSGGAYLGTGAPAEGFQCATYDDGSGRGYYVEARLPLITVTGRYDLEIGFDIRFVNAYRGEAVNVVQWADVSNHTIYSLGGVGTLRFN